MFSTVRRVIKKNKGLVVSSILIILALIIIVSESGLLSFFLPIPHSGCTASIYAHPGEDDYLILYTNRMYPNLVYRIETRRYWIGNTLYVKMVGIEPPAGAVLPAFGPAFGQISLEGVADGSYQVVLFWSVGPLNIKVESYKLLKYEGNLSIDRIESTVTTVLLADILYFTPWLLLCIGLLSVLICLLRRIHRKLSQKTTNVPNVNTQRNYIQS